MAKTLQVALLIETSRAAGRGLLRGVIRYLNEHNPWSLYFRPAGLGSPPPRWLKNWHGDGILARIEDRRMANVIRQTGLPAVDMRYSVRNLGLPHIGLDNRAVIGLAFEHLAECGFKQFAFFGLPAGSNVWMDLRRDLFQQLAQASGATCHVYEGHSRHESPTWEQEQQRIAGWLRRLPKPIGVMACNDDRGQQLLDACRRANIFVPDEVAVIGVDNDEILCNLSYPPLSSVDINTQLVGYEAAALLDRMMAGESAPAQPVELPPGSVVRRQSTDVLATEDRQLADAIRYIREHACTGLRLKDFLRTCGLSRRTLERRTQRLLGRSPKEEIARVQLERAEGLLAATELPVAAIAEKCGFRQSKYFSQVFHAKVGVTPAAYRRKIRNPS